MSLSVVITTYTAARLGDVRDVLASIARQTVKDFEIVFVGERDEALTSSVEAFAAELELRNFKSVMNRGTPGLSPARNLGVEQSSGEIIAFIDDDAVAAAEWAAGILRFFARHPDAIGLTGPAYPLWQDKRLSWWPEEFLWIVSCPTPGWLGYNTVRPVRNAWGMNMAFRREAFDNCRFSDAFEGGNKGRVDGIKLGLLGEDTEFCARLWRQTHRATYFDPAVRVRHKVYGYRLTDRFVSRRAFWEGYTKATLRRTRPAGAYSLGPEGALLRRIGLGFFPRTTMRLFSAPRGAFLELRLAALALSCVALGYVAGRFNRPLQHLTRAFAK